MGYSSIRLVRQQLLETVCCSLLPEVVETKSMQNKTFDPGGSQGHPRAGPCLGSWRALVCGEVIRVGAAG